MACVIRLHPLAMPPPNYSPDARPLWPLCSTNPPWIGTDSTWTLTHPDDEGPPARRKHCPHRGDAFKGASDCFASELNGGRTEGATGSWHETSAFRIPGAPSKPRSRLLASQWQSVGRIRRIFGRIFEIPCVVIMVYASVDSRRLSTVELKSKAFLAVDSGAWPPIERSRAPSHCPNGTCHSAVGFG
eukprot:1181500-Prorocentrum_minimum.AAC.3